MGLRDQIPDSAVVLFRNGIPGVTGREFVILKPDGLEPIVVLQRIDESAVGLPAIPCGSVVNDYQLNLDNQDREELELRGDGSAPEILYVAVVLVEGQDKGPCCNLAAPSVINPRTIALARSHIWRAPTRPFTRCRKFSRARTESSARRVRPTR